MTLSALARRSPSTSRTTPTSNGARCWSDGGCTGPGGIWFTHTQAAELDQADDPEWAYVERQLHEKLALDIDYLCDRTLARDVRVIAQTVKVLFDW